MQIRYVAAGSAGAVLVLTGVALGLAGPASAAPTASPTAAPSSAAPSPVRVTTPSVAPARTVVPTGTVVPAPISVPAGNAGPAPSSSGVTSLEIAGLIGAGVALLGGGVVTAVRRRA